MAMYFFDVDGDGAYDDPLGVDLDGIDAAKQELSRPVATTSGIWSLGRLL